jgi:manganese/zinc/iron transport system substrate-binding protein
MHGVGSAAIRGAIALFFAVAAIAGAGQAEARDQKLKAVATTGMVGDAARAVAGDRAVVEVLMGPGVDPHLYRQTRADVIRLSGADVIFYNGLYLEAQLEPLLLQLAKAKPVIAVAEAAPRDRLLAHDEYKDKFDPHVWMDPELWSAAVIAIRDALSAADPDGRAVYEANAVAYLKQLERLADYARRVLASVPKEARLLVTAHDAFNYFGRAYGFEVRGVQGMSTESEAGLKAIEDLVVLLVERDIPAIFVESSVSERNVQALIEGAKARGRDVVIGGELFSDAMGPDGAYEGTYLGMIDHNVTVISRALGGEAPEQGLNGALKGGY